MPHLKHLLYKTSIIQDTIYLPQSSHGQVSDNSSPEAAEAFRPANVKPAHNHEEVEAARMPISGRMEKQNVAYTYWSIIQLLLKGRRFGQMLQLENIIPSEIS